MVLAAWPWSSAGPMNEPGLSAELKAKFEATTVNMAVKEQALADVIRTLQVQTGLNLMIDSRVVSDLAQAPITALRLKNASLMTVLTMLAAQAGDGAVWISRNGVAVLTLREFAN